MHGLWQGIQWWVRVLLGLLAGFATLYVVVDSSRSEPSPSWYADGRLLYPAAIVLAVVALFNTLEGLQQRKHERREREIGRKIDRYLHVLHREISKKFRPEKRDDPNRTSRRTLNRVGLTVWMVPPWFALIDGMAPHRVRRLAARRFPTPGMLRVSVLRFVDTTQATGIKWRRTVGLIGHVWHTRRGKQFSMVDRWPAHDSQMPTAAWEAGWQSVPVEDQLNLTSGQARVLLECYSAALAEPIFTRSEDGTPSLVAVMTLDLAPDSDDLDIHSRHLRGLVRAAANRIADGVFQ